MTCLFTSEKNFTNRNTDCCRTALRCYAYVEVCDDMRQEVWLLSHVHAYNYFGGVTRLLVPDNLKTEVKSNMRYETILNRSYQEMEEHYDRKLFHFNEPPRGGTDPT